MILLVSAIIIPIYNNIDITEAATGTAKESSLSFNLTNSTASVDLSVNNINGTFATSTAPVSFNISTTNYTGYTLSIKNSKSTTTLVNSTNSSYTLSSLTGTVTPTNFSADSTTAATNYNGKWGYYPSKYNSSTNSYYRPSPTTTASTLDKTSSANTSGTVNSYTIGIGARASYTTPAGEYTGTYILTAIGNAIAYYVQFLDNTNDSTVASLPSDLSGSVSATRVALPTTTPTRTGYTFSKWCLGTVSNNGTTCTGTQYSTSTTTTTNYFYLDQTSTNGTNTSPVTLYALWTINTYPCYAEYRLQNADGTYPSTYTSAGTVNSAVAYGSTCTYASSQDTTYYTNQTTSQIVTDTTTLRLDIPRATYALTVDKNATYINSVTGAGTYRWGQTVAISATASTGNKFTTWSQTAGTGSGTTTNFASSTSASTTFIMPASSATVYANGATDAPSMQDFTLADCQSKANSASYTVKDVRDNKTYTVRYINGYCWMTQNLSFVGESIGTSSTTRKFTLDSTTSNIPDRYTEDSPLSFTVYIYSTTGSSSSGSCHVEQSGTVVVGSGRTNKCMQPGSGTYGAYYHHNTATAGLSGYDICPKNWHLPTGPHTASGRDLNVLLGSTNSTITSPALFSKFNVVLAGHYANSTLHNSGSVAYWWSSTSAGSGGGVSAYYGLSYNSNNGLFSTGGDGSAYYGQSVRCVRTS